MTKFNLNLTYGKLGIPTSQQPGAIDFLMRQERIRAPRTEWYHVLRLCGDPLCDICRTDRLWYFPLDTRAGFGFVIEIAGKIS